MKVRDRPAPLRCALTVALLWACGCGGQTEPAPNLSAELASQPTTPSSPFAPGQRLVYQCDYESESQSDFRGMLGGPAQDTGAATITTEVPGGTDRLSITNSFLVEVRGRWTVTVLAPQPSRHGPQETVTAFCLRDASVRLQVDGRELPEQNEPIAAALQRPGFATVDNSGRIQSVRFAADTDVVAAHFARALLAATQFVSPAKTPLTTAWETREDEPNGTHVARYEPLSTTTSPGPATVATFRKTKLRFLIDPPEPGDGILTAPPIILPSGGFVIEFDLAKRRVRSIEGTESQSVVVAHRTIGQARNTFRLSLLEAPRSPAEEHSELLRTSRNTSELTHACALSDNPLEEQMTARIHASVLKDTTLASLLDELDRFDAARERDPQGEARLSARLQAMVYLQPDCSQRLRERLVSADADSVTLRIIPMALVAIGHHDAQTALLATLDARHDHFPLRMRLLAALGGIRHPEPIVEHRLHGIAWNGEELSVSTTALFALGSMARNLSTTSPQRSEAIVSQILQGLSVSGTADQQRVLIQALGNAGAARSMSALREYAVHDNPLLRAASVYAMRWIEGDEAQRRLLDVLHSDSSAAVRLEAAHALSQRYPEGDTIAGELAALSSDHSRNVRIALVRNLWRARYLAPEVRARIEQTSLRDDSSEVRRTAAQLLATEASVPPPD